MDLQKLIQQGIIEEKEKTVAEEAAPPEYKIIHKPKPCEDCGTIVTNRILNTRLNKAPFTHYKRQCSICKKYENPETGKFDLNSSQIQYYYRYMHKY